MTNRRKLVTVLLTLSISTVLLGCAAQATKPEQAIDKTEPVAAKVFDETSAIIEVTDAFFSEDPKPFMKAEEVYEKVVKTKDPEYQIVDVRAADHFALGHIEGAINIPLKKLAVGEQLAKLNAETTIVVCCYTGHQSSYATMLLNQLGYRAVAMNFGITGWTTDRSVYGLEEKKIPTGKGADYETESGETTSSAAYSLPVVATGGEDLRDALLKRTQRYFDAETPFTTSAAYVQEVAMKSTDEYQLLSVQAPEDFTYAHIPGSINIPRNKIAKLESLKLLDPDKTIIVCCYTGHNGSMVSMFLNQLGSRTITLGYGISSWTNDPKKRAKPAYDPAKVIDYPVVKGET